MLKRIVFIFMGLGAASGVVMAEEDPNKRTVAVPSEAYATFDKIPAEGAYLELTIKPDGEKADKIDSAEIIRGESKDGVLWQPVGAGATSRVFEILSLPPGKAVPSSMEWVTIEGVYSKGGGGEGGGGGAKKDPNFRVFVPAVDVDIADTGLTDELTLETLEAAAPGIIIGLGAPRREVVVRAVEGSVNPHILGGKTKWADVKDKQRLFWDSARVDLYENETDETAIAGTVIPNSNPATLRYEDLDVDEVTTRWLEPKLPGQTELNLEYTFKDLNSTVENEKAVDKVVLTVVEVASVATSKTIAWVNDDVIFTALPNPTAQPLSYIQWEKSYRAKKTDSWSDWVKVPSVANSVKLNTPTTGYYRYRSRNGAGDNTWKESPEVAIIKVTALFVTASASDGTATVSYKIEPACATVPSATFTAPAVTQSLTNISGTFTATFNQKDFLVGTNTLRFSTLGLQLDCSAIKVSKTKGGAYETVIAWGIGGGGTIDIVHKIPAENYYLIFYSIGVQPGGKNLQVGSSSSNIKSNGLPINGASELHYYEYNSDGTKYDSKAMTRVAPLTGSTWYYSSSSCLFFEQAKGLTGFAQLDTVSFLDGSTTVHPTAIFFEVIDQTLE